MKILKTKNNKGVSLIEIILAITLLTVIAFLLSTVVVSQYSLLIRDKKITINSGKAVKDTERKIVNIKEKIKNGDTIDDTIADKKIESIFSGTDQRDVVYYEIKTNILNTDSEVNANQIRTYVGDRRTE